MFRQLVRIFQSWGDLVLHRQVVLHRRVPLCSTTLLDMAQKREAVAAISSGHNTTVDAKSNSERGQMRAIVNNNLSFLPTIGVRSTRTAGHCVGKSYLTSHRLRSRTVMNTCSGLIP